MATVSKPATPLLGTAFLLVIAAVPILDLAGNTFTGFGEEVDLRWDTLRDGSFARSADRWVEERSWSMRTARPYYNELLLGLFGSTPSRITVADGDWLFYNAAMGPLEEPDASLAFEGRLSEIMSFHTATQNLGITGAVFITPPKWRIYGDRVRGRPPPPDRQALYGRIQDYLLAREVNAPDILTALRAERQRNPDQLLFPRDDTHLSPYGYYFLTLRLLPALAGIEPEVVRQRLASLLRGQYRLQGDMLDLMSIRSGHRVSRIFHDDLETYLAPPTHDEPGSEILLFGDSNLLYDNELWPRLIQAATSMTVDARYIGWGILDSDRALQEYMNDPPELALFILGEGRMGSVR